MEDDKHQEFRDLVSQQDPRVQAKIKELIDSVSADQEFTEKWAETGEQLWKTLPSEISKPLGTFSKGPMIQSSNFIKRLGRAESLSEIEVNELLAKMRRVHEQAYYAFVGFLLTLAGSDA